MSQLSTHQPASINPGMTRCEWCACVYDASGNMVDPRPSDWGAIPHKVCSLCSVVERMQIRQSEAAKRLASNPKVKPSARGAVAGQRRLESVSAGRSCLPASDRD